MKIAFDLDGVLDKSSLAGLAKTLLAAGHEVHVITGIFDEAGDWQGEKSKLDKLQRHGIAGDAYPCASLPGRAIVHFLHAMPESYGRDYRLADLGLRKGATCERFGIDIVFDDSAHYCDLIPKMDGNVTVVQVR